MKRTALAIAVAMSLAVVTGAMASDETTIKDSKAKKAAATEKAKKAQAQAAGREKKVLLTGSYIQQSVRKNERITDGVNQVVVLDQNIIQRTGAADLKQLLMRQGAH